MKKFSAAVFVVALGLGGCKAPQQQTQTSSTSIPSFPSGGPPSPSSLPGQIPSPPSTMPGQMPSPVPSTMPSPVPSTRPGQQASTRPGQTGSQSGEQGGSSSGGKSGEPSISTGVGMPSPSIFPGGSDGESSRAQRKQARKEAGEALKRSGEEVWARRDIEPGGGTAGDQGSESARGQGAEKAGDQGMESAGAEAGDDDPLTPRGTGTGLSAEDLARIQEAIEAAGQAMQTAGAELAEAETDEEVAAAAEALGDARLAVLVASQDLADARAIYQGADAEAIFGDAETSLEVAKVAILVATRATGLPLGLPDLPGFPQGQPEESELDKELNESIAIYEGHLQEVRREVLGSLPPGKSASEVPGVAGLGKGQQQDGARGQGGAGGQGRETSLQEAPAEDGTGSGGGGTTPGQTEAVEMAGRIPGEADPRVPEGIPSPQGDDIVAQQLREAAIAEQDPALREKLWEEYKKYKEGL